MIRLLLFILVFFIYSSSEAANTFGDLTDGVFWGSQSESSSEYNLYTPYEFCVGVTSTSLNELVFFPNTKNNLFSDFQSIDDIKSSGFYITEANLLFLIRKNNLFLSILRI
jgi:hypothetical protein